MRKYKPKDVDKMTIYEVRDAYQAMRRAANKRIGNLAKRGVYVTHYGRKWNKTGGLRFTTSDKENPFSFPTASSMTNEELRTALADVSMWLNDPSHTVRGEKRQREFTMQQFHDKGYDFINDANFYDVLAFMDEQREIWGDKVFDSSAALDMYETGERIGVDPRVLAQDYEYYKKHAEAMDKLRPVRSESGATMRAIKDKINKIEKRMR